MKTSFLSIAFPLESPPPNATQIDRWYQLDAPAMALVEWFYRAGSGFSAPGGMVLASPTASNETDSAFAQSQLKSPQKFVHTLPNVRVTPLCQYMQWQGPVVCLQRDPFTLSTALQEAMILSRLWKTVWVVGEKKQEGARYAVVVAFVDKEIQVNPWQGLSDDAILKQAKEEAWNQSL